MDRFFVQKRGSSKNWSLIKSGFFLLLFRPWLKIRFTIAVVELLLQKNDFFATQQYDRSIGNENVNSEAKKLKRVKREKENGGKDKTTSNSKLPEVLIKKPRRKRERRKNEREKERKKEREREKRKREERGEERKKKEKKEKDRISISRQYQIENWHRSYRWQKCKQMANRLRYCHCIGRISVC